MVKKKKAITKRDQLKQKKNFKTLHSLLVGKGFVQISEQYLRKIWQTQGLIPPDVERVENVKDRISYIWYWEEYVVWVHTKHLRSTHLVSPHGAMTVVISKMKDRTDERVLTRFIQYDSEGDYVERLNEFAALFQLELQSRPVTRTNNLAILKEIKHEVFAWVNPYRHSEVIQPFCRLSTMVMFTLAKKALHATFMYHKKYRKKRKVKQYRRDIRKQYTKRKR